MKSIYILLISSLLTPTFPAQTETFETQNKEPIIIHPKKEVIHTEIKLPAVVLPQKILPIYLPNELPFRNKTKTNSHPKTVAKFRKNGAICF